MAKLVDASVINGQLIAVAFLMTTEQEKKIFVSFIKDEKDAHTCPHCKEVIDQNLIDKYYVKVDNPTSGTLKIFGFNSGTPMVRCPNCGKTIQLSMIDLSPFPEVNALINAIKQNASKGAK